MNRLDNQKLNEWISISGISDHCDPIDSAIVIRIDHLSIEIKPHVYCQLLSYVIHLYYGHVYLACGPTGLRKSIDGLAVCYRII